MKYPIKCPTCGSVTWIRGTYESDTNALVLDDYDPEWDQACDHIGKTGVYEIGEGEPIDEGSFGDCSETYVE